MLIPNPCIRKPLSHIRHYNISPFPYARSAGRNNKNINITRHTQIWFRIKQSVPLSFQNTRIKAIALQQPGKLCAPSIYILISLSDLLTYSIPINQNILRNSHSVTFQLFQSSKSHAQQSLLFEKQKQSPPITYART